MLMSSLNILGTSNVLLSLDWFFEESGFISIVFVSIYYHVCSMIVVCTMMIVVVVVVDNGKEPYSMWIWQMDSGLILHLHFTIISHFYWIIDYST